MTNEIIEHDEELETLYHQIATIVLRKDRHSDEAIALLDQARRKAKIEAYEEAMKATCELCMTEWPVREQMFGEIKGYVHDAPSATHAGTEVVLCKATNIRALRGSLVETVSTT